ncbi:DUF2877 domain-containing protein [Clostridium sp. CF012]|uniref:DUF2877 domain-containing protein n=1 Tax=Clostridium sp. CF012 TaxID=2843319 RepID=UPI001C0CFE16|nr:DUF2877 domain-containing protein [Clostridium sp. CF012]MBU3144882.1 DUF2877 domain-containing protein [Clostridium sp. CF012]
MSRDEINKNGEVKSNLLPLYLKNHSLGKVHSKFNNGLNIQFDDSLIYISCIGTPLSAFGLNIQEGKLKKILNFTRIDDIVVNKGDKLIFYSIYEIISIDYKDVEEVDLKLPKIKCSISQVPNTKLYNYLENIKLHRLIGIELDEKTRKYVNLLLNSNKSDLNINFEIIRFFSGRGKGLTPSGDDILIGFTIALMIFNKSDKWIKALELGISKTTTTMISVAYLRALLEGYASEYFVQLVKLIDIDAIDAIEEAIEKVQSFGHTSGNDALFGFLLGLKFLTSKEEVYHGRGKKNYTN